MEVCGVKEGGGEKKPNHTTSEVVFGGGEGADGCAPASAR